MATVIYNHPHNFTSTVFCKDLFNTKNSDDSVSVIAFDFDDTLLPNTFIKINNISIDFMPQEYEDIFKEIENNVYNLLVKSLSLGTVLLITNASCSWVIQTCKTFMPRVLPLFLNIKICSGCDRYNDLEVCVWKDLVFEDELKEYIDKYKYKNFISIGDSIYEKEALLITAKYLENTIVKTVEFIPKPTVQQLIVQLRYMNTHYLNYIFQQNRDIESSLSVFSSSNSVSVSEETDHGITSSETIITSSIYL